MKILLATIAPALLLCACAEPTPSKSVQRPPAATASGMSAATLTRHAWRLDSATDPAGRPIPSLRVDPQRPLRLTFTDSGLNVSGGCNAIGGFYKSADGALETKDLVSTLMACADAHLMEIDDAISQRLAGKLQAHIEEDAGRPRLILVAANGDTLTFSGEPTPETRYGGKHEVVFLEIAAQPVPCAHPMIPDHRCLQVRERTYDANGVQTPVSTAWQPLYEGIEGYRHVDGRRDVARVKRFDRQNPPADASSVVYVLDAVIESEAVKPE